MKVEQVRQALHEMALKLDDDERRFYEHTLLYGSRELMQEIFLFVSKELRLTTRRFNAQSMEKPGDLAAVLTHMKYGDMLWIDEAHRFNTAVMDTLYQAMTDFMLDIVIGRGEASKNVRLNLARFSITATTTVADRIPHKLLTHFGKQLQLDA